MTRFALPSGVGRGTMERMYRAALIACLVALAGCGRFGFDARDGSPDAPADATTFTPGYPRLGATSISNPHDYSSLVFREAAAKRHVVVVAYYPEWQGGSAMTLAEVMADVKARSTIGTRLFIYINNNDQFEYPINPASGVYPLGQKLEAERWWVYPVGTTGMPIDPYGHGSRIVNTTSFTPADSNGKTWAQVNADFNYAYAVAGDDTHAANPSLDGFFVGNVMGRPVGSGDYDRDGVTDPADSAVIRLGLQAGARAYFAHLRAIWPTGLQLAGMYYWDPPIGVMDQMANGGGIGPLIGESFSVETVFGFDQTMAEYARALDAAAPPKLVMFSLSNWTAGDYQTMRYGLGAALMDDGYFDINNGVNSLASDALWFDEFAAPLGEPMQPRQNAPWQQGVWRRDFAGGIALVNPKGNGLQTVALGGTFRRLGGAQDPVTNSGATVTSVTLADRDGLILLR